MVDVRRPYHLVWLQQPQSNMARLDRNAWLLAAFEALCESGIDDVGVNSLCATLGVTKGSFYWHFEGLAALHTAMLEGWEARGTEAIIATVDGAPDLDPEQRVRLLLRTVFADEPQVDRVEAAIRAWAAHDPGAAAVVARVDARRLDYVRDLLRATGQSRAMATRRSALLYRTLIGEFTWRSHGGEALDARSLTLLGAMILAPKL